MVENFIVWSDATADSGRNLSRITGFSGGHAFEGLRDDHIGTLVRWGYSGEIPHGVTVGRTINEAPAIRNCVNKKESLRIFNRSNVNTPQLYENGDQITYPVVVRPISHKRGEGFKIIALQNELEEFLNTRNRNSYYIQELILKSEDYRVFVFRDVILRAYKLYKFTENANKILRNDDNGWRLQWSENNRFYPDGLFDIAFSAIDALKLDFGAVDMGVDVDGKIFVYEVNTGPFLNDERLRLMNRALKELI